MKNPYKPENVKLELRKKIFWLISMFGCGIYAIIILIWLIFIIKSISQEESHCLKKYGKSYQDYIDKTPRWLGLPKNKPYLIGFLSKYLSIKY